jgi:hypothetical protein
MRIINTIKGNLRKGFLIWRIKRLEKLSENGGLFLKHDWCINDPELAMLTRREISKIRIKLIQAKNKLKNT